DRPSTPGWVHVLSSRLCVRRPLTWGVSHVNTAATCTLMRLFGEVPIRGWKTRSLMAGSLAAFVLAAMAATGLEPAGPPLADLRQVAARADRLGAAHITSRSGYLVALPSFFPGPPAGSFAVVSNQAGEGVSSQGHAGVLAIALATALGAALLISLLVKRHLSKSTLALAQVAQRVGDTKDFSIRASVTG